VLLEGNPILLAVTGAVSMLHTVFDMLAFKNDIGFWQGRDKSLLPRQPALYFSPFIEMDIIIVSHHQAQHHHQESICLKHVCQ